MVDTMTTIRDMIAELGAWLKEPPCSDLSDLLRVLIATNQTISSQVDEIGIKMDAPRQPSSDASTTAALSEPCLARKSSEVSRADRGNDGSPAEQNAAGCAGRLYVDGSRL
jgi:hypothetical protein